MGVRTPPPRKKALRKIAPQKNALGESLIIRTLNTSLQL